MRLLLGNFWKNFGYFLFRHLVTLLRRQELTQHFTLSGRKRTIIWKSISARTAEKTFNSFCNRTVLSGRRRCGHMIGHVTSGGPRIGRIRVRLLPRQKTTRASGVAAADVVAVLAVVVQSQRFVNWSWNRNWALEFDWLEYCYHSRVIINDWWLK